MALLLSNIRFHLIVRTWIEKTRSLLPSQKYIKISLGGFYCGTNSICVCQYAVCCFVDFILAKLIRVREVSSVFKKCFIINKHKIKLSVPVHCTLYYTHPRQYHASQKLSVLFAEVVCGLKSLR